MTTIATIATIVKANATTLTTACDIVATSTSKGVPGQFDKLIDLINQLPQEEVIVEAGKLKGVFKALKEGSKDCNTFKFVLACNEWGLEPKNDNSWVISRPEGDIILINGSYTEPTQPEEVAMEQSKPKTFCQLLKDEWLPSRESWVIDTLKRKMRATWKARKELTCERQGKFMAEFFRRLDVYSPNTELPLQAFLTTYDLVKEAMTGQKTQTEVPAELKPVQKDHNTEEVNDAYTNHLNSLLNKFPDRSVVVTKENDVRSEETQEELGDTNEPEEELSEGKVTIKTMLGDTYTIEVFYNKSKTLWINARSGESFSPLFDLCMVHDKEYFNHEFFAEGQPSADTTSPQYKVGDILAVTYDDEHNEYAYYGSDLITVKAVVVQNGFQLGEGEDAEVFATIHELCYKASEGNYEGTPEVRVVTEEEIEDILEKEYNIGMGIE